MLPLHTTRLHIRVMQPADAPALAGYRNDPLVAEMQGWPLPYSVDLAAEMLAGQAGQHQPTSDGWTQLAMDHDGRMIGDLPLRLDGGAIADIGWTLAPDVRGRGFASEGAIALVEALFATGDVHRVVAELHPANVASSRVAEAAGLVKECTTRLSYPGREGWEDTLHYAICRDEWTAWRARPMQPPDAVRLVPLDHANQRRYAALATHASQRRFVATVAESYADALFGEEIDGHPVAPWFRGVEADGEPAGFVMLADATEHHPDPFLWRLLIDRRHQGRGIGRAVIEQLRQRTSAGGGRRLLTSYVAGVAGTPEPFYRGLGFEPTGEMDGDETIAELRW